MEIGDWYLVVVPILIGLGILGFWFGAIVTHSVPEIDGGGIEIWFHIAAEVVTGFLLAVGGIAVLVESEATLSIVLSSLSLGMLIYTLIASPGYYAERAQASRMWMFAGIWALTIPAVVIRFVAT